MAELTEKQLLLLDNLMYYSGSTVEPGTCMTVEQIATSMKNNANRGSMFSGGFEEKPDQVREIAQAILDDKELCSLKARESIDANAVRATCFVGEGKNDVTVAIRGTGGSYDAWGDNVYGAFQSDSKCQEAMTKFVSSLDKKGYSDLTITGHSKGGNLAQYSTITNGNLVDRCVSFDGQGFSSDFIKKYSAEIGEHSSKIKAINGNEDYVNILGNSICEKNTVYLRTTQGENAHSPYALWEANKNETGSMFSNTVEQSPKMVMLDCLVDKLLSDVRELDPKYQRVIAGFLAFAAGAIFGDKSIWELAGLFGKYLLSCHLSKWEKEYLKLWLLKEMRSLNKYLGSDDYVKEANRRTQSPTAANARGSRRAAGDHKRRALSAHSAGSKPANIDINIATVKAACGELVTIGSNLDSIQGEIAELTGELLVEDSVNAILKQKLSQISRGLGKDAKRINKIGEAGAQCMELYASTESSIAGMK